MSEEERKESIRKALAETEKARTQAQESARRFREVEQGRPFGPLPEQAPEARKHQKVPVQQLEGFQKPQPQPKPRARQVQEKQSKRRVSRRGTFGISFFRPKRAGGKPPNRPDSPANIDPEEKRSAIDRLDLAIARENRKYAFQIAHGGTDIHKNQTRQRIQQLENERRAVENMKPKGRPRFDLMNVIFLKASDMGHVRKAESN